MTTFGGHILGPDTTANRPAAATTPVGTLYANTTTNAIERNNGASWDTWVTFTAGGMATDALWDTKGDLAVASGANAAAKLAVGGTNGFVLTVDSGETLGVKWAAPAGASEWTTVSKSADETVNNSNTFQDDDHLFFTATSGKLYRFELYLIYAGNDATPDLKIALGEDATARGSYTITSMSNSDTAQTVSNLCDQGNSGFNPIGTAATKRAALVQGWHLGNGGTFKLKWAQFSTGAATSVTLYTGSYLRYVLVA